jgi:hypothetical protein
VGSCDILGKLKKNQAKKTAKLKIQSKKHATNFCVFIVGYKDVDLTPEVLS